MLAHSSMPICHSAATLGGFMAFEFHARFMIARIGIGVMCKHFVVFEGVLGRTE